MSTAWALNGTVSHGSASCTPTYPATVLAGDLLVLAAAWGNASDTVPSTPAGFTAPANNTYIGGAGAFGLGTGHRGITVWTRIADGTETGTLTVSMGGTTPSVSAQFYRFTKTLALFAVTVVGGTDETADTAYSATAASDPGAIAGDTALVTTAWSPQNATVATPTLTWAGTGASALTTRTTGANVNGNGVRLVAHTRNLTGASSGLPVYDATMSLAGSGATAIVLVSDSVPNLAQPRAAIQDNRAAAAIQDNRASATIRGD